MITDKTTRHAAVAGLAAGVLGLVVLASTACRSTEPSRDDAMVDIQPFSVRRVSDRVVVMRRGFRAPASTLFAALTQPEELRRWLSADGRELTSCEVDLRPGGGYRYEFTMAGGRRFGMHGVYREIVPGERIVNTEAYDGYDWPPLVVTTGLAEVPGGTMLDVTIEYPTQEICDVDFPNLEGAGSTYEALGEHLAGR